MKENYEAYLSAAKKALEEIGYLTDDDRGVLERGIKYLEQGYELIRRDDSKFWRQAAGLLMVGAYYCGSCTGATESQKEYWRRYYCGKGGEKPNSDTQAWKDWALTIIARYPDVKASAMTDSLLAEKSRPSNLPGHDHLIRFVRDARKQIAANKGAVRLVHSAQNGA